MTVAWTWLKRWRGTAKSPSVLVSQYEGKDILLEQMGHHHFGGMDGIKQAAWSSPDIGCNILAMALGADLIMFGPIENCEGIATATAFTDIVLAESARELGLDVLADTHPIYNLI